MHKHSPNINRLQLNRQWYIDTPVDVVMPAMMLSDVVVVIKVVVVKVMFAHSYS